MWGYKFPCLTFFWFPPQSSPPLNDRAIKWNTTYSTASMGSRGAWILNPTFNDGHRSVQLLIINCQSIVSHSSIISDPSVPSFAQWGGWNKHWASSFLQDDSHVHRHAFTRFFRTLITLIIGGVTPGSPGGGQGPLGPADIRPATRLPPQSPGPPGIPQSVTGVI